MKSLIKLAVFLCVASTAYAGSPVIWGPGGYSVDLQPGLKVPGLIWSTSGGIKFPDNSIQTTASAGGSSSVPLGQQAWVAPNGDDGTGAVGDASKPFLTIAAAETAITDAATTKPYVVNIGPGTFEPPTAKKSNIGWNGAGNETTVIDAASPPINMTGTDLAVPSSASVMNFSHLKFSDPVNLDTVAAGLSAPSSAQYWFNDVHFLDAPLVVGYGGESVAFQCSSCSLNGGLSITSGNSQVIGSFVQGAVSVIGTGTAGSQLLALGSSIAGSVTVTWTGSGASISIFGMSGGFMNGPLTVDGAQAQAILPPGAFPSVQYPTLVNSGGVQFFDLTQASATQSRDDTGVNAMFGSSTSHTTVDGSNTTIGVQGVATCIVDPTFTNDKGCAGGSFNGQRTSSDDGTLQELDGVLAFLQHQTSGTGTTVKAYGVHDTNLMLAGNVTNLYDFASETIPAGAVVTNHYGLFLEDTGTTATNEFGVYVKKDGINYMKGGLGLGTSSPDKKLDVRGGQQIVTQPTVTITGTVDTAGTAVTGSGTAFTTQLYPGDPIVVGGEAQVVASVASDTALTTVSPFSGSFSGLPGLSDEDAFVVKNSAGVTKLRVNGHGRINVAVEMVPHASKEQFTVTTVADVLTSLQNTYFEFHSALDIFHYYVWLNVDGLGTDPLIPGAVGLEAMINANDADTAVATAVGAALTGAAGDFNVGVVGNVVTATSLTYGPSTDVVDGAFPTGFGLAVTIQGANPAPTAPCEPGEVGYDPNFYYVCVATNTWKRTGLDTFAN